MLAESLSSASGSCACDEIAAYTSAFRVICRQHGFTAVPAIHRRIFDRLQHALLQIAAMAAALLCALSLASVATAISAAEAPQAVLQHHKVGTRQGFYLWSHLAKANVAKTTKSKVIKTSLTGSVYGQLLYYEQAGTDLIIAVTEANHITATNAATGKVAYDRLLAPPMTSANLPCGNIYPTLGVTSALLFWP